jgi:hypothetical protein
MILFDNVGLALSNRAEIVPTTPPLGGNDFRRKYRANCTWYFAGFKWSDASLCFAARQLGC